VPLGTHNIRLTDSSGIAVQLADGGYFRRGNCGCLLVCSMVLIHSPDGTNVCGQDVGEVMEMWSM